METQVPDYFWADRLIPVNYYGYVSCIPVSDWIFQIHAHKDNREMVQRFLDLKQKCLEMYVDTSKEEDEPCWVKDVWDNKVVIECKVEDGDTIFVSYYDDKFTIGKSVKGRIARPYKIDP